jgi:ABC-type nitrate/sulfonate/bicarbonate transport system permease component
MSEMQTRPIAFRGGGFVIQTRWSAAVVFFAFLLGLWEVASRSGWVSALALPPLSAVGQALIDLARSDAFWRNITDSLFRIVMGWSTGTAAGLCVGVAMGIWSLPRAVGLPAVAALFPIPKIALLPLFILWLGIGEASKITTIALGVFFPTVIATYSGIDSVPRNLIRMAQSFNLPWPAIVWKIILPGALPAILAGFRISASIALILLVSAEMIGAQYGIGQFILTAGNLVQTDQLLAGVVILSLLGLVIGTGLTRLERWVLRWR